MEPFLAVDPGKNAGFATYGVSLGLWCLRSTGALNGDSIVDIRNKVRAAAEEGCKTLVIEDQFPGRKTAWKSLRTLVRRAMIWVVLWEAETGFCEKDSVVWVAPATWQSRVLGGRLKSKEAKEKATAWVKAYWKFEPSSADVACAICLGHAWIQHGRFERP